MKSDYYFLYSKQSEDDVVRYLKNKRACILRSLKKLDPTDITLYNTSWVTQRAYQAQVDLLDSMIKEIKS